MDLDDLRIFRAVVREGGITRAAARLHRVQSNVTTRIRQLEAHLGVPLFVREGRRLSLAPAGAVLSDYAERLLELADQARAAVADAAPRGRLRLGSMESTAAARLPTRLAAFHQRYPDVQLELHTGATAPLLAQLRAGELDCVLVCGPVADARLCAEPAFMETLALIAPAGHPPITRARDVLQAMEDDSGIKLKALKVDGGAVANNFLMQFQSDILGVPVDRPMVTETTAMGAAFLAGLAVGFWKDKAEIAAKWNVDRTFKPAMAAADRDQKYKGWTKAVERSRAWEASE